jgi:LL-H family phage holin
LRWLTRQHSQKKEQVDMNPVLEAIINSITPVLVSALIAFAVGVVVYLYQFLLQRLPMNAQRIVQELASIVVNAIEQTYAEQNLDGPAKKQQAMKMMQNITASWHIPFDQAYANAAIEAAVYSLNLHKT